MGIAYGALRFIFEEGRKERWRGNVLTLGRQDISFTYDSLNQASLQHSYVLCPVNLTLSLKKNTATNNQISDQIFFRSLGFSNVFSLDKSKYEGADIIHDLNIPEPPQICSENYDLVLDGGTLEHIFHIPNALSCIVKMVKPGGRIIHISPMSNCADHGFYSFSPTLFVDYYSANNLNIENIVYIHFKNDPCHDPWTYHMYSNLTLGSLDTGIYFVMACIKKLPISTSHRIPQQGYYEKYKWQNSGYSV